MNNYDIAVLVISATFILLALFGIWSLYCNDATLKDRTEMLKRLNPGDDDFQEELQKITAVSYDRHFRARLTLRDPNRLYE